VKPVLRRLRLYRHFRDMDELGLTMVDEAGLTLRQLMRQARKRIANGGSVIVISVETFFEFINNSPNVFRLLLRESSGTSQAFRTAAAREIKHFTDELSEYIARKNNLLPIHRLCAGRRHGDPLYLPPVPTH